MANTPSRFDNQLDACFALLHFLTDMSNHPAPETRRGQAAYFSNNSTKLGVLGGDVYRKVVLLGYKYIVFSEWPSLQLILV